MPEIGPVVLTFGGGIHSRRRLSDIDLQEAVFNGENFSLDPEFAALNPRAPFDLVATTPNAAEILGYAQLQKSADNSITTLIQSGTNVYDWDGDSTFNLVGTVASGTKMRGGLDHNYPLNDVTIITDLAKSDVVKTWDGTTFADLNHGLGGDLKAKFCRINNDRVWLGNVTSGTDTPHVVLASAAEDFDNFNNDNKPSSALGLDAAFFMTMPNLRPINGMELSFGEFVFSTERDRLFVLSGSSAFDFAFDEFHRGSAVVGDEAMESIGNDIALGIPGRIDTLSGIDEFGDVRGDDISIPISDLVEGVSSWRLFYDRKRQDLYCFSTDVLGAFLFHKRVFKETEFSPWTRLTTSHSMAYNPSTVIKIIDPLTLNDEIYFGDTTGNIYRAIGTGTGDGGTDAVKMKRRSKLIQVPGGNAFDIRGWINYRSFLDVTVTFRILGGGSEEYDYEFSVNLPQNTKAAFYGGAFHYNRATYYGVGFSRRLKRREWQSAGYSTHFQVEVELDTSSTWHIEEIGFWFFSEEEE